MCWKPGDWEATHTAHKVGKASLQLPAASRARASECRAAPQPSPGRAGEPLPSPAQLPADPGEPGPASDVQKPLMGRGSVDKSPGRVWRETEHCGIIDHRAGGRGRCPGSTDCSSNPSPATTPRWTSKSSQGASVSPSAKWG